jgi:hypothetical protein
MSDLKIDVGEVLASASSAERIAGDFSAAERIADETAGYTGHDGLAGRCATSATSGTSPAESWRTT